MQIIAFHVWFLSRGSSLWWHVSALHPLNGRKIFHCMDIPHIVYPLITVEYLGHLHLLATMNNAVRTSMYKFLYEHVFSVLLGIDPEVKSYRNTIFNLFGNCSFPKWLSHFTFPPAAQVDSNFSKSSLPLILSHSLSLFLLINFERDSI